MTNQVDLEKSELFLKQAVLKVDPEFDLKANTAFYDLLIRSPARDTLLPEIIRLNNERENSNTLSNTGMSTNAYDNLLANLQFQRKLSSKSIVIGKIIFKERVQILISTSDTYTINGINYNPMSPRFVLLSDLTEIALDESTTGYSIDLELESSNAGAATAVSIDTTIVTPYSNDINFVNAYTFSSSSVGDDAEDNLEALLRLNREVGATTLDNPRGIRKFLSDNFGGLIQDLFIAGFSENEMRRDRTIIEIPRRVVRLYFNNKVDIDVTANDSLLYYNDNQNIKYKFLSDLTVNDTDVYNLTGTVSNEAGSTTLTGVGTLFTTELQTGYVIKIGEQLITITAVNSNTSLTVSEITLANSNVSIINPNGWQTRDELFFIEREIELEDLYNPEGFREDLNITIPYLSQNFEDDFLLAVTKTSFVYSPSIRIGGRADLLLRTNVERRTIQINLPLSLNEPGNPGLFEIPQIYQPVLKIHSIRYKDINNLFTLEAGFRQVITNPELRFSAVDNTKITLDNPALIGQTIELDISHSPVVQIVNNEIIDKANKIIAASYLARFFSPVFTSVILGVQGDISTEASIKTAISNYINSLPSGNSFEVSRLIERILDDVGSVIKIIADSVLVIAEQFLLHQSEPVILTGTDTVVPVEDLENGITRQNCCFVPDDISIQFIN